MDKKKRDGKNFKINNLLKNMDKETADSFNYKQRKALNKSLNANDWGKHSIDFRPTIAVPFLPKGFYLVLLAGSNKREVSSSERFIAFIMFFIVIFLLGLVLIVVGLILIYLLKSWLGIDLFPNESLGLWDQFQAYIN